MSLPELEGAIDGAFCSRFPPEASGPLHLGHLKALLINSLYARKYHGIMILRFDDTNPEKEDIAFEKAIEADISSLGVAYDKLSYTSDYFPQIIEMAKVLIEKGLAFVDTTDAEEVSSLRSSLKPSIYRDQAVSETMSLFEKMIVGESPTSCLRAKIDYRSKNGCMRDPVIFRSKNIPHPRSLDAYKIYPTYDFSCPIIDSLDGITHAMRSVEYTDRLVQYNWFLDNLPLKNKPLVIEYGKLNFSHTVLSKRKLGKLVKEGLVSGWDDPRMPTVEGIFRRGMQLSPLMSYIESQLASKNVVNLSSEKMWNLNSTYLNTRVKRLYGLKETIKVQLLGTSQESVTLSNHPADDSMGSRTLRLSPEILLEKSIFEAAKIGDRFTLIGLGNAKLIGDFCLLFDPDDCDFKKTIKATWLPFDNYVEAVVKTYGHLLSKAKLEVSDEITAVFNRESEKIEIWAMEASVESFKKGDVFQVMQKDYCIVDSVDPLELIVIK
jgi:glutamyl/glutaminyl-tRNA synthetase